MTVVESRSFLELLKLLAGEEPLQQAEGQSIEFPANGLGFSQLNESLLLCGFDRVCTSFFQLLLDGTANYGPGNEIATLDNFRAGVTRFIKLAMLNYGSIRRGYKDLGVEGHSERVQNAIDNYLREKPPHEYEQRHEPVLKVKEIPANETYLTGYLVDRELSELKKREPDSSKVQALERKIAEVREKAKQNFDAYIASDHMDVYVATSMRERHEFVMVRETTEKIFSHPDIKGLNLRFFDPTQAFCEGRIDKGLAEALMLNRSLCTIYLVQESDTFGKDSELAATLAQGKVVIAYVPEFTESEAREYVAKLRRAMPESLGRRECLRILARTFCSDEVWHQQSEESRTLRGWLQEDGEQTDAEEGDVAEMEGQVEAIVARCVCARYDRRADLFKKQHPLGLQVFHGSGVAYGVLVVRREEEVAAILKRVVTNTLQFDIDRLDGPDRCLVLREQISGSIFRVVTENRALSHAFWNFYS